MSVTRRHFLMQLAASSGYAAAHAAMTTLGLGAVGVTAPPAAPVLPPPGSGKGRRVLVLGAGIAGRMKARTASASRCRRSWTGSSARWRSWRATARMASRC